MVRQKKAPTTQEPQSTTADIQAVLEAVSGLQLEELVTLQAEVEVLIKRRQKEKQKELLAQMLELAKAAGYNSLEAVVGSKQGRASRSDKGVKMPPKYQNPQDATKTWSGKGRKPNWILEHIDGGGQLDDLEIS